MLGLERLPFGYYVRVAMWWCSCSTWMVSADGWLNFASFSDACDNLLRITPLTLAPSGLIRLLILRTYFSIPNAQALSTSVLDCGFVQELVRGGTYRFVSE